MKKFTLLLHSFICFILFAGSINLYAQQVKSPQFDNRISSAKQINQSQAEIMIDTYFDRNAEIVVLYSDYTFPYGISPNGNYIAIQTFNESTSYLWSAPNTITPIEGYVYDVTDEGRVCGSYVNEGGINVGGYWENGQWNFIGMHPNYPSFAIEDYNNVWAMTSSGNVMVGMQFNELWEATPFKWSVSGGYQDLPSNGLSARPNAVCDDASVIGGWCANDYGSWLPALWINDELVFIDPNSDGGEVNGISRNGQYATGYNGTQAFVWSSTTGIQAIENTIHSNPMDTQAAGACVSNDGTVFGYTNESWPPFVDTRVAFVKTLDAPMTTFNEYAVARGWDEAANWSFYAITDVSPNGNTLIGAGVNPSGQSVTFKVTFGGGAENHMLTLAVSPQDAGVTYGAGTYQAGEVIVVSATPNEWFTFINWTDENGTIISESANFDFTMPDSDCTLTANFDGQVPEYYFLTLFANPVEGGVVFGDGLYLGGTTANLIAMANENYQFENWTDEEGNLISEQAETEFTMPYLDTKLYANFAPVIGIIESNQLISKIYPNPVSDILYIEVETENVQMKLMDAQGRVVLEQVLNSKTNHISLEGFTNGLYFMQLNSNSKQSISKIEIR